MSPVEIYCDPWGGLSVVGSENPRTENARSVCEVADAQEADNLIRVVGLGTRSYQLAERPFNAPVNFASVSWTSKPTRHVGGRNSIKPRNAGVSGEDLLALVTLQDSSLYPTFNVLVAV